MLHLIVQEHIEIMGMDLACQWLAADEEKQE